MKRLICGLFLLFSFYSEMLAQQSWQKMSFPSLEEVAGHFQSPPPENGMVLWWGWDGPVNEDVIVRDLDFIKSRGFSCVMIEAGYGMIDPYLSPGWFNLVKIAVKHAKERQMRVWVEDEGKYPSGFAGGKFSAERPDLRMQGLVIGGRIDVSAGQTITRSLQSSTVSAVAVNRDNDSILIVDIHSGQINWTAPEGHWQILLANHEFKTSATRSVNNPARGKDTSASLFDYLNPDATRQFIAWTHEQYKKYLGDEFGKTFMGFMGDEPDFAYTPWTPKIADEFLKRKGYDVRPYLAAFFEPHQSERIRRIKADYWDVWSQMFSDNFFSIQAAWCAQNKLEYIVHLNHEEQGMELVKSEGDYFRDMRHVGVPGVDAIWSQIWMDHEADYPKIASSAAHLFGRPRAFTESFAAYTHHPSVAQAKWVIDYQLVRGINLVQVMFMQASSGRMNLSISQTNLSSANIVLKKVDSDSLSFKKLRQKDSFFTNDSFISVAGYVNRATYLLSAGKPAARIAVYFPTTSMWLGDRKSNESMLVLVQELLEHQRDFDFIDEQAISSCTTVKNGELTNLSGQGYRTVIVPPLSVISEQAVAKLKLFAQAGGKVVFLGHIPELLAGKTFVHAVNFEKPEWAIIEPSTELAPALLSELPQPDFSPVSVCPSVKYLHRRWKDADLYFFFNESDKEISTEANLSADGPLQDWNATSGKIDAIPFSRSGNHSDRFHLKLGPWETKFVVAAMK